MQTCPGWNCSWLFVRVFDTPFAAAFKDAECACEPCCDSWWHCIYIRLALMGPDKSITGAFQFIDSVTKGTPKHGPVDRIRIKPRIMLWKYLADFVPNSWLELHEWWSTELGVQNTIKYQGIFSCGLDPFKLQHESCMLIFFLQQTNKKKEQEQRGCGQPWGQLWNLMVVLQVLLMITHGTQFLNSK